MESDHRPESPLLHHERVGGAKRSSLPSPGSSPSLLRKVSKTPSSPSSTRSHSFSRNGSIGKGPSKVTIPQAPMLATERRSQVRPCGCGKPGHFNTKGGHKDHKDHGHDHKAPEPKQSPRQSPVPTRKKAVPRLSTTKIEKPTEKPKEIIPEKPKEIIPEKPKEVIPEKPKEIITPKPLEEIPKKKSSSSKNSSEGPKMFTSMKETQVSGPIRYISTLFWAPKMEPIFYSNVVDLNSSCSDQVDTLPVNLRGNASFFTTTQTTNIIVTKIEQNQMDKNGDNFGSGGNAGSGLKANIAASRVRANVVSVS